MHRAAVLAIVVGLLIGVVGGPLAGMFWLGVGAVTATVGITVLWGLAIWKNPAAVIKAEAEVEAMASGYPTRVMEPTAQDEIGSTPTSALVMKKGRSNEPAP